MVAGNESDFQPEKSLEKAEHSSRRLRSQELTDLLETVIQETTGLENHESLELVLSVARKSQHDSGNTREAVEEVVRAIVDHKFGMKKFSNRLVRGIATTLLESPDAVARLAKLWQESRAS